MDRRLMALAVLLTWLAAGMLGCEAARKPFSEDDDSGSDGDTDTDGDTDADSDSDVDEDCTVGELFCMDNNVYECIGPDNEAVLVEECESPLVCMNGMCVDDDACGYAIANKSNIGCEYYGVDMDNYTSTLPYAIVVSNLDAATVHVMVEQRNSSGWTIIDEADLESKNTHVFMLGDTSTNGSFHQPYKAFRVTSDLPVVAYQFNPYGGLTADDSDVCTNDGTLLIPTSGLDNYYYGLVYPPNVSEAMIVIAGTVDGTTVEVTPTAAVSAGTGVPAIAAGTTHTFTVNQADVVQLESMGDLSGTYIESDQKIAVWGGNDCAFVPSSISYCDHLEHQLLPITTWGMEFVAARSVIRSSGTPESDWYRVIASEDGTTISTSPAISGLNGQTMNAGQVIEVGSPDSFTISASAPIMVGQFLTGHMATDVPFEGAGGDPAFALIAPYEQFLTNYVFLAPEKYIEDYVVITIPNGLTVELDGTSVSSNPDCITYPFSADWEIAHCLIADFTHTVDAAEGVGIMVWGYGGRVSYGYTGGLNLETINPIVPE